MKVVSRKAIIVFAMLICLPVASRAFAEDAPASTCYGTTSNGRLENGVKLPAKGNNFQAYSLILHGVGRTYVHSQGYAVVTSARDLTRALDAGVDEIAHMVVDALPVEIVARMVAAGTRWVPTLELWQGVDREYPVDYCRAAIRNLAMFVDAGGEVVLGTDYAGAPNVHFDLGMPISEIELMQEAGMTPMQIVVAATKNAARACNMETTLGTLEAGKLADVLVVDGNPLDDIQAFTRKRLVLREGNLMFPSSGVAAA